MLILTIRTDKPEAELGLYEDFTRLDYLTWPAHRELSATMHYKIRALLGKHGKKLHDVEGIVCLKGPGSFTGLRIGLSVGNALAYSLHVPIVGTLGEAWIDDGIKALATGAHDSIVVPEYGADAHITTPKK